MNGNAQSAELSKNTKAQHQKFEVIAVKFITQIKNCHVTTQVTSLQDNRMHTNVKI